MTPRLSPLAPALVALALSAGLAQAQGAPPSQAPGPSPVQPSGGVPVPQDPPGPVTTAPGSPPAASSVDISSSRPESLPRMEGRPAATQVVPGPDATGAAPTPAR
jgi:hypothetical protein